MNNDNRYLGYLDEVKTLAQTMVIKSADAASSLNQYVSSYLQADVDDSDPTTWKYYMNLAGEYHPTDTVMSVVSMDNLETIVFSKENLVVHTATAAGYAFGTRQYQALVSLYPNQEMLILGILYPVDKTTAIAAADLTILGYPPNLIESNEYTLVPKLQRWLDDFRSRWVVQGFKITDALYPAVWLTEMFALLRYKIAEFRLEACKSNEAHSFHVSQYLASHGLDESYTALLTLNQSLWLYRNIEYLRNNVGKQETLDLLIQHLMTERSLPIAEYTMRHDVSHMPDDVYPTLAFRKKTLNGSVTSDTTTTVSLGSMLDKEDQFARSNAALKGYVMPTIQAEMENSTSSVVMTKLLESAVVDHSNNTPYTLNDILMNHWLWLASKNLYTAFIGVQSPKSTDRIPLSVKDAFVLCWYAFCTSNGITLTEVPEMYAERVQRIPTPTVDDLMSVVDKSLIDVSVAQAALAPQPVIKPIISTSAFYNLCQDIFTAAQVQRKMVVTEEHAVKRGMTLGLISRVYSDNTVSLVDGTVTYAQWFADRNINIADYSISDLGLLYVNIVKQATGLALVTTKSLKDLQAAMIRLLGALSSYSIQLNAEINSSDILITDWPVIRIGNVDTTGHGAASAPDLVVEFLDVTAKGYDQQDLPINPNPNNETLYTHGHAGSKHLEIGLDLKNDLGGFTQEVQFNAAPLRFKPIPALKKNARNIVPVIGIDAYLTLSLEDQSNFTDVYGNTLVRPTPPGPPASDVPTLSTAITVYALNGLKYDNTQRDPVDIPTVVQATDLPGFDK